MNAKRKAPKKSLVSRMASLLFVIAVLLGVLIIFDYVLFSFGRVPLFSVTEQDEAGTEHIGLVYVVTEDEAGTLAWHWIWNKLFE